MNSKMLVWLGGGALAVVLLLLGLWLVKPPSDPDTQPISAACREQIQVQQQLADLALKGMRAFGRIDPGLYEESANHESLRLNPAAVPLAAEEGAGHDPDALPLFKDALERVTRDESAGPVFAHAHAKALRECGSACPPKIYPIKITALPSEPNYPVLQFDVGGEPPTNAEWKKGFLVQYANEDNGHCPFVAPIQLNEPALFALRPAPKLGAPTEGERTNHSDSKPESPTDGARVISSGAVQLKAGCSATDPGPQCCTTTQNKEGKYKVSGPQWCCHKQACPTK